MSAIKSVRHIEAFLCEFDRHFVGCFKKCPLLTGVRYRQVRPYRQTFALDKFDCIAK